MERRSFLLSSLTAAALPALGAALRSSTPSRLILGPEALDAYATLPRGKDGEPIPLLFVDVLPLGEKEFRPIAAVPVGTWTSVRCDVRYPPRG